MLLLKDHKSEVVEAGGIVGIEEYSIWMQESNVGKL